MIKTIQFDTTKKVDKDLAFIGTMLQTCYEQNMTYDEAYKLMIDILNKKNNI